MSLDKSRLPEPVDYFTAQGLTLTGKGTWRTTRCEFHGGSDSMRINVQSGGWVCMSCGCKGGDILSYEMQAHGLDFVDACKALGIWDANMKPDKPRTLSARDALHALQFEAMVTAVSALNLAHGTALTERDLARLKTAAARINLIAEDFHEA